VSDSYDVIVIGSGAGGGTLVHRLAPSGKRILLLERMGAPATQRETAGGS
jgi:choline dehydrogenase-like flavoprotein